MATGSLSRYHWLKAASWNLEAIENAERIAAAEASASVFNWTFAPMVGYSHVTRVGGVL